jgi:hypothetical protein
MKKLLLSLVLVVASLATIAQENGTLANPGDMLRRDYDLFFAQGAVNELIPDAELSRLLGEDAFGTYCNGRRLYKVGDGLKKGGWAAFGGGLGLMAAGITTYIVSAETHVEQAKGVGMMTYLTGVLTFIQGNILIPTGYILRGIGAGKISRIAEDYNSNHGKTEFSYSISPSVMPVSIPQSQNNVGLGLTFSLNF